jgi:hypothetical protein
MVLPAAGEPSSRVTQSMSRIAPMVRACESVNATDAFGFVVLDEVDVATPRVVDHDGDRPAFGGPKVEPLADAGQRLLGDLTDEAACRSGIVHRSGLLLDARVIGGLTRPASAPRRRRAVHRPRRGR